MKISIKKSYWQNNDVEHWKKKVADQAWLNSAWYIGGMVFFGFKQMYLPMLIFIIPLFNNTVIWIWYNKRDKNDQKTTTRDKNIRENKNQKLTEKIQTRMENNTKHNTTGPTSNDTLKKKSKN